MKLIVQADDYAMTDAIGEGILTCARNGILTQTGLMTNGPHAAYYAERMEKECPHVSLGQDINLVSGLPLSDPKKIPTLVDSDGVLLKKGYHRDLDMSGKPNHISYEDAYTETEAQVLKFMEITGHKPYYVIGHSYDCENTIKAKKDVFSKYGLITYEEIVEKCPNFHTAIEPWNFEYSNKDISIYDAQMQTPDPLECFKSGKCGYLTDYVDDENAVVLLHTHAGFVDYDLLKMSTLTLNRAKEAEFLCSDYIKKWVADNNIELIGSRELIKMMGLTL